MSDPPPTHLHRFAPVDQSACSVPLPDRGVTPTSTRRRICRLADTHHSPVRFAPGDGCAEHEARLRTRRTRSLYRSTIRVVVARPTPTPVVISRHSPKPTGISITAATLPTYSSVESRPTPHPPPTPIAHTSTDTTDLPLPTHGRPTVTHDCSTPTPTAHTNTNTNRINQHRHRTPEALRNTKQRFGLRRAFSLCHRSRSRYSTSGSW